MSQDKRQLGPQVTELKTRVENYLTAELNRSDIAQDELKAAMKYSLLLGGKRMRPFLVYATAEMFNVSLDNADCAAGALECIHSYSLIHDDLPAMDDDELRRGKPTCHIKFGEATAILAGDTLQSFAFELLSKVDSGLSAAQQVQLVQLIASAATKMCAGQAIDLAHTNDPASNKLNVSELEQMHRLKTGALIIAAVKAGAICGNANPSEMALLSQYAEKIGLAFQVWDDVLDIISDTETLGKPQGSDLEANKSTYPALLGLEKARQKAQNLVQEAVQALHQLPYNTSVLQQLAFYIIERDH